MFTINNYDYDCTKKCKCLEHGKTITYALTKKSVEDKKLAAFIAKTCRNFAEILDYENRSALHIASSVERYLIAEWLINNGSNINLKDGESSHTPLHRALFYGNIDNAVLLIKSGALLEITDDDFRTPLQHFCNPGAYKTDYNKKELLVWGSNKNYNLGIGNEQGKQTPQHLEELRKKNISIEQVSISSYHSVFLSDNGDVFTVGHGKGGRLGIGIENTLVVPKKVGIAMKNAGEKIICISAGRYHTLILSDHDIIYSTGLNTHNQLGLKPPPEKLLNFKEIGGLSKVSGKGLKGVIAHDTYSLAYSDTEMFIWGTNFGQFGLKKEIKDILLIQEMVINDHKIKTFDSNNSAIACYTSKKYLYVFHKFLSRSYKTPGLEIITNILIHGSDSDNSSKQQNPLKILILTESTCLFIWYEDIQKYVRCMFPMIREFPITKMKKCAKKILFLSNGDLYMGTPIKFISHQIKVGEYTETYNKKDICDTNKVKIELKKIPIISRAYDMFSDDSGENFAVLQENPRSYLNIPKWKTDISGFGELLNVTDEFDTIHDVIFYVNYRKFPGHKFIIANRAPKLYEIVKNCNSKTVSLEYQNLSSDLFNVIFRFIYTNVCHTRNELLELLNTSATKESIKECLNNFRYFLDFFGINDYQIDLIKQQNQIYPSFDRKSLAELYDVTILCLNNQEIKAHKCVLVSRLEYFNMMFSHTWSESNIINLKSIPLEYMEPIIDYLYSLNFTKFLKQNISENFIFTMITICDQFFIEQMKYNFEILILERLSIKNCGEILEFANSFNCEKLEKITIEYICMNLDRILEIRSLDNLEVDLLRKINKKYRELFKEVDYRKITPYADAVDDDILDSFVSDFTVDLDMKTTEMGTIEKKTKKNKVKQSRTVLDRRQYEKDGITLNIKNLGIDENIKSADISSTTLNLEAQSVSNKFQTELKKWTEVKIEKKDLKKKLNASPSPSAVTTAIKINKIIQGEPQSPSLLTNLNEIIKSPTNNISESPSSRVISFGDFTPIKTEKLSQKQRKRLSSETSSTNFVINTQKSPSIEKTIITNVPQFSRDNVWGLNNNLNANTPSLANIMQNKITEPIDIPNNRKSSESNQFNDSFTSPITSPPTDIFSIQKDEKFQKDYYEKMKSKSLVLTQIEETAIEDLAQFYNVDNVFDETITIERKRKITLNFAVWNLQKN